MTSLSVVGPVDLGMHEENRWTGGFHVPGESTYEDIEVDGPVYAATPYVAVSIWQCKIIIPPSSTPMSGQAACSDAIIVDPKWPTTVRGFGTHAICDEDICMRSPSPKIHASFDLTTPVLQPAPWTPYHTPGQNFEQGHGSNSTFTPPTSLPLQSNPSKSEMTATGFRHQSGPLWTKSKR